MSAIVGQLGLVTLHVHDIQRSVRFYRDTIGLPLHGDVLDVPGMGWAELEVGGGLRLGLHEDKDGIEEGCRPPGGASGFYFAVPNVDKAIEQLRAAGVRVVDEPADKPYGRDACIEDPDGNVLALVTPS